MKIDFSPKLFSLLRRGISREQLTKDIFSGVIVGIVALPLSIAFAVASGVSPEKGLITAIIAGFIISSLGGSRVQIGGPTGAFIVIVLGIVNEFGLDGLIISTILAGIFQLAFGFLRLGTLLKFIPQPMVIGFTSGIAIVIFSTQIKDAFGLSIDKLPSDFIEKLKALYMAKHTFNIYAIAITLISILISVYFRRITTKIPGSFVAIILCTASVYFLDIPVKNIENVFGEIKGSFSFVVPSFHFSDIGTYIAPAITIALLGSIESLLSAVVSDGMISGNHKSNTELIANGIANILTPFFGGIPATGAIARTATNVKNGGRTPISGIVHAITLLLIMIFFGRWAKLIPLSCLAGILIVVAYNMSEWRSFVSTLRSSYFDIIILLATFFLTIFIDLSIAIQVGIVLSSLLFMKRMADTGKFESEKFDADLIDQYSNISKEINTYEISGPFFFGTAKHYTESLIQAGLKSKVIIIRMRHVPFIDSTGCDNFKTVIENLQKQGIKIILSGVNPKVLRELAKYRITFIVGKANIHGKFENAVLAANKFLAK